MPTKADFDAAIATVNEHLDGITADLASLKQQLQDAINASGGGLSAADAQTVLDSVTALATKAGAIDAGQ